MNTLKELIAEGLPVGALVNVYELINETTFQWNGKIFTCVSIPDPWYQFGDRILEDDYSTLEAEPTTAYDSQIAPETLPIPEPFWTGWVVVDRMKDWVRFPVLRYHYSGDLMTEIECSDKINSKLSPTDCQPCLPPA